MRKKKQKQKKTTFQGSSHHDDDYQFALAVQERFKTLPPGFNVKEFERSEPIVGGENASESTTVSEQLLQDTSGNPVPQANDVNFDTLTCHCGKSVR